MCRHAARTALIVAAILLGAGLSDVRTQDRPVVSGDVGVHLAALALRDENGPAGQSGPRPTFRSGVELVTVDATVVDEAGQPIAGLGADAFDVSVDGKPRRVVSAQFVNLSGSTPGPALADPVRAGYTSNEIDRVHPLPPPDRFVVLAVDHSSFVPGGGRQTIESARRFLSRLDASDRVALASYPDPGIFVPPTTDHAAVARALGLIAGTASRIEPAHMELSMGLSEALDIAAGDRSTFDRVVARECYQGGAATDLDQCRTIIELDAPQMVAELRAQSVRSVQGLQGLLDNLKAIGGRKTLVLISAGLIASNEWSDVDVTAEARVASATAAEADTVIHALHVDTAVRDAYGADRRRVPATVTRDALLLTTGLDLLVGLNGGALFRVVVGADAAFARIAREISAYYVLGVEPAPTDRDGKAHAINVRVPGRGRTVRHRRQFTIARASAGDVSPDEELATILRSGQTLRDLPVRVSTQAMRDLKTNNVRVLVRADIGRGVTTPTHLRVGLALFDAAGQPAGSTTSLRQVEPTSGPDPTWPFQEIVTLRPGVYTLRLAVRDADGRTGSVVHRVEATVEKGDGLRISDLLVMDTEQAGAGRLPTIIDGRLRGPRLGTFVEVYPDRTTSVSGVSFTVAARGRDAVLMTVPGAITPWPGEQRVVARAELDLRTLPPGDYVVTATAFDRSTARGHVSRPITIVVPAAVPGASAPAGADRPPAPSDAAPPAKAFERDDLLRPDALDYFLSRLRVADEADATPAVQSAADAAARGDFRAVLSGLDAAEPTSLSVPALKGLALFATGAVEPAALQFRASLQISREFLPAAFYLGACYAASGRDEQAAAAWQIVLLAEGDEPFIFEALADAWLRLQNGEQALAVLARARQRWPDEARFVWRTSAAQALVKKGSWPVSVP